MTENMTISDELMLDEYEEMTPNLYLPEEEAKALVEIYELYYQTGRTSTCQKKSTQSFLIE